MFEPSYKCNNSSFPNLVIIGTFEKRGPGDNTFRLSIVTNANKCKNVLYPKLYFYIAAFAFIPI